MMRRRNNQDHEPETIELRGLERSSEMSYAPELLSAVERRCANFLPIVLAHYFRLPKWNRAGQADRRRCAELLPQLFAQFEQSHGRIVESYFCRSAFAAAVLTDEDEIRVVWGANELQFPERTILLFDCRSLAYRAWHRLTKYDRRHCQMMIFGVITEVLRRIDRRASSRAHEEGSAELQYLHDELKHARRFYLDSARQRARLRYTAGMLAGAVLLAAILVPFVIPIVEPTVAADTMRSILLCVIAGASGALVSVLSRMTFDRRTTVTLPSFESAKRDLWFLGGLRPFVGATFGLLMYVFLNSTLLPVKLPVDDVDRMFFFTSVAFLAGFSERFAQDVFLRSGRAVSEEEAVEAATERSEGPQVPPRESGSSPIRTFGEPRASTNGHAPEPASRAAAVRDAAEAATETATGTAVLDAPDAPGKQPPPETGGAA